MHHKGLRRDDGGKADMKGRSDTGRALGRDRAAVHAGDPACDREPQPRAGSLPGTNLISPMKPFEDRFEFRRLDAYSRVFHTNVGFLVRYRQSNLAASPGW